MSLEEITYLEEKLREKDKIIEELKKKLEETSETRVLTANTLSVSDSYAIIADAVTSVSAETLFGISSSAYPNWIRDRDNNGV